jgi:hypothetical protein
MTASEYLQLLDWTARRVVPGKPGSTPQELPPILRRVGLRPSNWIELVKQFGDLFYNVAGQPHRIAQTLSLRRNIRFRVRSCVQQAFSA